MREIYRHDGELCGFVRASGGSWDALTLFGGLLQVADSEKAAEQIVPAETGLSALAERWLLTTTAASDEQVVCLQEASPTGVTVTIGYYSLPGVPTQRITRDEIDSGQCRLRRSS